MAILKYILIFLGMILSALFLTYLWFHYPDCFIIFPESFMFFHLTILYPTNVATETIKKEIEKIITSIISVSSSSLDEPEILISQSIKLPGNIMKQSG